MQGIIEKALGGLKAYYKTKGLEDIVRHRKKSKNLIEILSFYPNKGEGFKVWQNTWKEDKFAFISHVSLENNRKQYQLFGSDTILFTKLYIYTIYTFKKNC